MAFNFKSLSLMPCSVLKLKLDKNNSRVLEVLESEKEKIKTSETQRQINKTEEEANFYERIKVGVMLPLSGEHSEIGNLILNQMQ